LAADQGNANAQSNLGVCYKNGTGVTKDEREAVRWYRLAADQGKAAAQFNLGVCYADGTGVSKDERESVRWYRLAADQGDEDTRRAIERIGRK
jgi:TPR repeat protein